MKYCFLPTVFALLAGCASGPQKAAHSGSILGSFGSKSAYNDWTDLRRASFDMGINEFYEAMINLSKKYPEEHVFKVYQFALQGDYGQTLSAKEEKEYKERAINGIQPYTNMKFKSPLAFDALLTFNEYYYHSGQYLKQYQHGKMIKRMGGPGNFSIAVGGAMHALSLTNQKKCKEAKLFAKESFSAWESIKTESELAHTPFYIAALALTQSCEQAQKIFDEDLSNSDRYKEAVRWMQQFNPKNNSCC